MKKIFYLLLILLLPLNVKAEDEFIINCDKTDKINIGEQIVCRLSVNSEYVYNQIDFNLPDNNDFELIDVRSNYDKMWKILKNDNKIITKSTELQSNLQEFGILLLKSKKSGEFSYQINEIKLTNNETTEFKDLKEVSTKLKVISTDNLLKEIRINDELITNFNPNTYVYNIPITDEKTIKIDAVTNNEYAKINGTGEYKLSSKIEKYIFPITVISEDNTSKIYTLYFQRDNFKSNNIDKSLDGIIIKNDKGNNLILDFSKDTYEYNIDVDINTKSLDIKPTLNNDKLSFVKDFGEQTINLNSGNNIAIIKVIDEEGEVLNYVLNITKPLANKSSNNYIKSLNIKDYNLKFSKKVKTYTLTIKPQDTSLIIEPILDNKNAKYEIIGNKNLKEGSIIKIIVTAENEEKTTYKINIKIKKTNYLHYFIILIVVILVIYALKNLLSLRNKNVKKSKVVNKNNTKSVKKVTKKPTTTKKKTTSTTKKPNNSKSTRNPKNNYTKKKTTKKTNSKKKKGKK